MHRLWHDMEEQQIKDHHKECKDKCVAIFSAFEDLRFVENLYKSPETEDVADSFSS